MSIPHALRNEFFKYRKRKKVSLDGSVPGIPYQRFRRFTSPSFYGFSKDVGSGQRLYNWGQPRAYRPNINSPNVQLPEYETQGEFIPMVGRTPNLKIEGGPSGHMNAVSSSVMPVDDLVLEEQLTRSTGAGDEPLPLGTVIDEIIQLREGVRMNLAGETVPSIMGTPTFSEVSEALNILEEVLPEDHPDVLNLQNAADSLVSMGLGPPEQVQHYEIEQVLGSMGSYDTETAVRDVLEDQQQFMQAGAEFVDDLSGGVQAGLEAVVEAEMAQLSPAPAMPMTEPMSMDSFSAGQVPDMNAATDEINQAVDQAMEMPTPEQFEPDPWQMQFDPLAAQQYMYDPMYMANGMMPNPMGPMQMGPMGPMPGI